MTLRPAALIGARGIRPWNGHRNLANAQDHGQKQAGSGQIGLGKTLQALCHPYLTLQPYIFLMTTFVSAADKPAWGASKLSDQLNQ